MPASVPEPLSAASRSASVTEQLATALARPGQLAPLPEVALEAMRLADDPNANGADLVRVVSSDPALSARVLKIVNSAFYGARSTVSSIDAAVRVLGFSAIKNIAVAASLTRTFRSARDLGAFDPRALWTHSVAVGTAARLLAQRTGRVDSADAFLAGLMHDIGVIVELQVSREQFLKTLNAVSESLELTFRNAELQFFGATHEAYGEALAIAWHFPASLRQVCGYHHRPEESGNDARLITSIVHAADVMAAQADIGYSRSVELLTISPALVEAIGVTVHDVEAIQLALPMHMADALPALS